MNTAVTALSFNGVGEVTVVDNTLGHSGLAASCMLYGR